MILQVSGQRFKFFRNRTVPRNTTKKNKTYPFDEEALSALQVTAEDFLLELLKQTKEYADNENHVTIMSKDLERATNELQ